MSGRKRNLLVDTLGLVVLAKVTAANVQDVHAGKQLFSAVAQKPELLTRLEKIFADGGYRGELVDWVQQNLHAVLEIVLKLGDQKVSKSYPNVGWWSEPLPGSLETDVWLVTMNAWQNRVKRSFMWR